MIRIRTRKIQMGGHERYVHVLRQRPQGIAALVALIARSHGRPALPGQDKGRNFFFVIHREETALELVARIQKKRVRSLFQNDPHGVFQARAAGARSRRDKRAVRRYKKKSGRQRADRRAGVPEKGRYAVYSFPSGAEAAGSPPSPAPGRMTRPVSGVS